MASRKKIFFENITALDTRSIIEKDSQIKLPINLENFKMIIRTLNIQETELEFKNEELKRKNNELNILQKNYNDLYNNAPISYFTIDINCRILNANNLGIKLIDSNLDLLKNNSFKRFITPDFHSTFESMISKVFMMKTNQDCEVCMINTKNKSFNVKLSALLSANNNEVILHIFHQERSEFRQNTYRTVIEDDYEGNSIADPLNNYIHKADKKNRDGIESFLTNSRDTAQNKLSEKGFVEKEKNYKHAESIAHVGSFQIDLRSGSCKWSDELFRLFGFEAQSFQPTKSSQFEVMYSEDRNFSEFLFQNAITNKADYKFECRIQRPSGEVRYAYSMGEVIMDEDDQPKEVKGVFQDVTDLKKTELSLKKSEENYRLLFESMPVGLAISDKFGKIIYGNKRSRILLGITRTELKEGPIDLSNWKFINKEGGEIPLSDLPNMNVIPENRIIENSEIGVIKENNEVTWLNVTAAQMPDQEEVLIAFIDISEKIIREKQLKELSEKLIELNVTKDKFFSIIAHDLKNPFNSILGFSDLLLKNVSRYSSDEIERFIGIINSTSQNAYNLLENLLNWSRSQTGTIEFCPGIYNLTDIVGENLEIADNLALKKNITLLLDSNTQFLVEIDKNMIDTVLRNLLTNAIKFSYPGGKIKISIKEGPDFYEISIVDNGMGIEEENIDKLFRIDNKYSTFGTNHEKGSGLGLMICKEFVEKNKGKIWVNSEFGKGSEFIFSLPKIDIAKRLVK